MMTFEEFEAQLSRSVALVRPKLEIGVDKIGELAETLAAAYIGHEQASWPPLAASTIREKAAAGYPTPSPLLRKGDMQRSISRERDPFELAVVVGSRDKVALYQEMGTHRIPPRPFLALGLKNAMPHAEIVFGEIAVSILSGRGLLR